MLDAVIIRRGLIRIEHNRHESRVMLWLEPEMERFSICEKRDMGAEWMTYEQSNIELSGALICSCCRTG